MADLSQIACLEARRRMLVAESEQHRRQLTGNLENLRSGLTWVEVGYSAARSLVDYWPILASAAGLLFGRKRGSRWRVLERGLSLWRLGRVMAGFWRRYSSESASSDEEP